MKGLLNVRNVGDRVFFPCGYEISSKSSSTIKLRKEMHLKSCTECEECLECPASSQKTKNGKKLGRD